MSESAALLLACLLLVLSLLMLCGVELLLLGTRDLEERGPVVFPHPCRRVSLAADEKINLTLQE
jgi:hypothetical protein